mmetsp:Transcript_15419/g.39822  ORF Transcript_15419/g.39822 Transcript_15419/m.39822 type:complete len:468 (-) Transcript_15419:110-1513(-)
MGEPRAGWPTRQYHGRVDALVDDGTEYSRVQATVYQDMSQPLSRYYISAGHNSYLEGNQLTGRSGVATIKRSLILGCRVLELDCWNPKRSCLGGAPRDVVCTHGGTLTSNVSFIACCQAIRDAAFVTSPYPVIVNLDLHVSEDWAEHMARVIKERFGDMLYVQPPGPDPRELPSPDALQHKIVLRTAEADSAVLAPLVAVKKVSKKDLTTDEAVEASPGVSVSFVEADVDARLECNPGNEGSVAEMRKRLLSFRKLAARHLARVYPDGIRIDSSNFCPWSMWFAGASCATLNWQVWDRDVMTNLAFFRDNGACGYVLKPRWALGDAAAEMVYATLVAQPFGYRSRDPKRKGRVRLRMCVHGTQDNIRKPTSESEPWVYSTIKLRPGMDHAIEGVEPHRVSVVPEIAVLTVRVDHKSYDGMVGVPLNSLRPGRFWFPVLDTKGHMHGDVTMNDWLAMDIHLEEAVGAL